MEVVWYPGCGRDFSPVSTLLASNPRREHVPRNRSEAGAPTLWMMDYDPEVARYFDRLRPGDTPGFASLLLDVDGSAAVPIPCEGVAVRSVRFLRLDGDGPGPLDPDEAEEVRRLTDERRAETWGDAPSRRVSWDVAELILGSGRSSTTAETMRLWFSPFESEAAIRHVFTPLKVRLHSLVLVRLGGFSCQRSALDHHGRRFFSLLHEHGDAGGTGLPEYVLTEMDASLWGDPAPYEPAGVSYRGWVEPPSDEPDAGVRLLRKREGEIPSSTHEQNPRSRGFGRDPRGPRS